MEYTIQEKSKKQLSLTRVLREIKSLDEQINNFFFTKNRVMVSVTQGVDKKTPFAGMNIDDLTKQIQADHDELQSLINRRFNLKRQLIIANANTKVTVSGKEYSIAEAIELKKLVPMKEAVVKGLRQQLNAVQAQLDKNADELRKACEQTANNLVGKDSDDVELRKATLEMVTKNLEDKNKFFILDPKNIRKRIEELDTEINEIKNELDYRLSEINATTFIEVD